MILTINYLAASHMQDAIKLGARVEYEPDDPNLIHVTLANCRMYVRDQYVKIRDTNHNIMIIDKFDFESITIF